MLGFVPNGAGDRGRQREPGAALSEDRHTFEVDSVYNSLIRLRTALQSGDSEAIGEAVERIDVDLNRVIFARGEIGTRLQTLDAVANAARRRERAAASRPSRTKSTSTWSRRFRNLTARQYALQASLQMSASILNMSILDYL